MKFYAKLNTRADLNEGDQGFANTWNFYRFATKRERDAFVAENWRKRAEAVTRKQAISDYAATYYSTGDTPPPGGLMAQLDAEGC